MQIFTARPSRCHSCNRRNKLQLWHLCRRCLHMFLPLVWTGHPACQQLSFQCLKGGERVRFGLWKRWVVCKCLRFLSVEWSPTTSLSGWLRIPGFHIYNFQISIPRTSCHPPEARSRLPISFRVFGFIWSEGLARAESWGRVEVSRSYSCIMNNNDNHTKPPRTSSSLLIQPFLLRTQQLK